MIKRVLLFFIFVISSELLLYPILQLRLNSYLNNANYRVVLIGNSHVQCALDSENIGNFGESATPFSINIEKATIVKSMVPETRVFVGIDYKSFSREAELRWTSRESKQSELIVWSIISRKRKYNFGDAIVNLKVIVEKLLSPSPFGSGYSKNIIAKDWSLKNHDTLARAINIDHIESELYRFIWIPDGTNGSYRQEIESIFRLSPIKLNFIDKPEFYADDEHLNENGSKEFTQLFESYLCGEE